MNGSDSVFDLEAFLNSLIQRLFPVWYATQAVKELPLGDMGSLNPNSFLSHRWLSLHSVVQAMQGSLENADPQWQELAKLLPKLIIENDYQRPLSVSAIQGVEYSSHEEELPSLLAYAEAFADKIPWEKTEQFEHNLAKAFPDADKPHRVIYREWDGRYYWVNKDEPNHLAAVLMHCHHKQRDARINAHINVESLHMPTLDAIRAKFWLLVMRRDDAYRVLDLLNQANMAVLPCEFEWRRSDLLVLVCRKNNHKLNTILLNLQNNRSSQQITDLGRYLSRHHHPFRNQ
jgi:hypothetical protein